MTHTSDSNRPAGSNKAIVLRAAGINCDGETVRALEMAGATAELVHLERVLQEPARLEDCSLLVLPGGFSYGDDIAAGRVFGFEMRQGLSRELAAFVARGGYVLGVCNGFQVLCEAGLLSGALLPNTSLRFVCRQVELDVVNASTAWTSACGVGDRLSIPAKHTTGRYWAPDPVLDELEANNQVVLRYAPGENFNGSARDIAGVCNAAGNVVGLMPHPEHAVDPLTGSVDGLKLFESVVPALA